MSLLKPPKSEKKPISPDEISNNKKDYIHPDIIEIVNNILAERYSKGKSVTIKISEITDPFFKKNPNVNREKAFDNNYFDIEDVYEKEGWSVEYDSPGYNESYEGFFEFKKKRRGGK